MQSAKRLFVATPMYGGMCTGHYAIGLADLAVECARSGVHLDLWQQANSALINRSRAEAADAFLQTDCSHLLFIDADIGFRAGDALTLLKLQTDDSPFDLIGAPYSAKAIAWEKIIAAVNTGVGPSDLANYGGNSCFLPFGDFRLDQPGEIAATGFGFTMIRRQTLLRCREAWGDLVCHPGSRHYPVDARICMFFEPGIDPNSQRYMSEDWNFCRKIREMGMKVWLCPWLELRHTGTHDFYASLRALTSVGLI